MAVSKMKQLVGGSRVRMSASRIVCVGRLCMLVSTQERTGGIRHHEAAAANR